MHDAAVIILIILLMYFVYLLREIELNIWKDE